MIYYARLSIKKGRTSIKRRQLTGNHTLGIESEISEGPDFTEIKSADPRIIERFIAVWKSRNDKKDDSLIYAILESQKKPVATLSPKPRREALKLIVASLKATGELR